MNIYRITHIASGKSYVGKNTRQDPKHRWKDHQQEAVNSKCDTYNTHFHRAVRKHGPAAFEFSSLAFTDSPEELALLETKFIKELKTDDPKCGYNSSTGGETVSYNKTARKNMSEAAKRTWANSPDRKEALSRRASGENSNFFGEDHSGEKNGFFGKRHSSLSRKRISKGREGKGTGPKPLMIEAQKRAWSDDPQRKKTQSRQSKSRWSNPEFRERMKKLFASEDFRRKCNPHRAIPAR